MEGTECSRSATTAASHRSQRDSEEVQGTQHTHLVLQAGKRSAIEHRHLDQPSQIPNLDQPSQIPILVSDHGASREKEDTRHLDQPGQIPILVSGRGACREATFPVLHAGGVVMMER